MENTEVDTLLKENVDKVEQTREILKRIPTPLESARLFHKYGVTFNKGLLNDPGHYEKYTSTDRQALNLGIYGSDLSYAAVFDQTQIVLKYLSCAQKLASELEVKNAVDESLVERINNNVDDRDSLLPLVGQLFRDLETYLEKNGREKVIALSAAGGWVEGVYLVLRSLESQDTSWNQQLVGRLVEQQYVLDDLIALIGSYESHPSTERALNDLRTIRQLFGEIETIPDQEHTGDTLRLKADLPEEQFRELLDLVTHLRDRYVDTGAS